MLVENKQLMLGFWPNPYVSVSALQSFESCPLCFYLHYYCGIRWPERDSMRDGSIFQEALNLKYANGNYADKLSTLSAESLHSATKLIEQVDGLKDGESIISIDSQRFADFGLGIPVIFIPDLLTTTTVREHKFTTGYYNKSMVQTQKQGTLYYWGVYKELGFEPNVEYYLFNKKTAKLEIVKLQKTKKDVDDMLEWMRSTLARIKRCYDNGMWSIRQHGKYDCDLRRACPIKYGS